VSIRHGGPRPRRCAGGVIRGVINDISSSRSWLITFTINLTLTTLIVRKSVGDTHAIACRLSRAVRYLRLLHWCVYKTIQLAE